MPLTVTEGTQTDVYSVANAGTEIPVVKLDVGSGTAISDFGGTIPRVNTIGTLGLGSVTVTSMPSGGTISTNQLGGTVNLGTVQIIGQRHADEFATVVTTGTSVLGTIRAAVTGSAIYVTGIAVSVQAASNVVIGNGGTSLPILGTLFFAGSAGIALTPIDPPLRTTSGSALVYQQSANTGMSITCVGYID